MNQNREVVSIRHQMEDNGLKRRGTTWTFFVFHCKMFLNISHCVP